MNAGVLLDGYLTGRAGGGHQFFKNQRLNMRFLLDGHLTGRRPAHDEGDGCAA